MKITQNKEAQKLTIAVEGRLDTSTAPEFERMMADFVNDTKEIVFDMANLEYVSSAGLRVILKLHKIMSNQDGLKLIGVNDSVMEVFEITGFSDILNIE